MLPTFALTLALLGAIQNPAPATGIDPTLLQENARPDSQVPNRVLIYGGRIYLGNRNGGVVEALLIEDGRVLAGGPLSELDVDLDDPRLARLDLHGAVAVPGLQDAHGNLEQLGTQSEQLDLRGLASYEELVARVAQAAQSAPEGAWILGWGWDQQEWENTEYPHHARLSAAVDDHPVLLRSLDGDALLVNANVLRRVQLDQALDKPARIPGGKIVLDGDLVPTGILLGTARKRVLRLLGESDQEVIERRLLSAQAELLALGLTCVHDMGVSPGALKAYIDLRRRGLLKLRIVAYLDGNQGFGPKGLAELAFAPDREDTLSVAGVYFTLDGNVVSRNAAMLQGYSDEPTEIGRLLLSEEELTRLVNEAWLGGLQPAIAARGDRANRAALDTIERMQQVDDRFMELRPRIEHAQVISPRDIPRFPELRITASMQPVHSQLESKFLLARLGTHRLEGAYLWRRLAPGWMKLAFGSDFPAALPGPLRGFHAALMRQGKGLLSGDKELDVRRLGALDVLALYTRGAAYAVHQEDRRGQLLPGYWADLSVLDIDPMEANPEQLLGGQALLTMVNGRVVYRRSSANAEGSKASAAARGGAGTGSQLESSVASKRQ